MQCPRCQHDNNPGAKFCEECAAPLTPSCANCGVRLSPSAKFCTECGSPTGSTSASTAPTTSRFTSPESYIPKRLAERILDSRAELEGERKHVTVLFADLKSSMELLADRDPEEARRILDPVLEHMMEAVHHYEGTVNQVMGDGIMALFGAPLAHEDHAVRACYAALRMQDRVRQHADEIVRTLGVPIRIRVGLNTGDVVVRSIGNDLQMDYTAVGQTTHLAARMEQMADPGTIVATAETVRLAEGYVDVTPLGGRPIRGLNAPVEVYVVTGTGAARWPLEAAVARGLTGFVGRETELAQLGRAVESAAQGRGQVVGVVGDPGIGKSRLFYEATRPERMSGWLILKTGAASYGKTTAYRPVIDLLRTYFKVHDQATHQEVRESITARLLALDKSLVTKSPALFSLLEVPVEEAEWQALDPRQRRQQTVDAVVRVLIRESHIQPLCLILEDLHWIDSETQALLDSLIESVPTARLLLLVNYRPEYRHTWGSKSYYQRLRMDPLPPPTAQQLLSLLLGDDLAHTPLKQLLIERTKGNPFFLEESVRTLAENGVLIGERGRYGLTTPVQTIQVPLTVQAVLAARIDRLAAKDKQLLQSASVIGENVPVRLLQAVVDIPEPEFSEGLARLRAAEFLYDVTLFPEAQYIFRHGLTCQVAYNSLLRDRRRILHGRIVDATERLYPEDRLGEHVERLAHHALQGELWDRAARYLQQAGTKAFGRSANRETMVWFEQALKVLARLPETPGTLTETVDVHLGLRNALTLLGEHERTLEHLRQAQVTAERLGDRRRLGRALSFEVNCLLLLGLHERAIDTGRRARTVAEELGDMSLRIVTDMYVGRAHLQLGDFARTIDVFGGVVTTLTGQLVHDHLGIPVLPSVFARSHLVEALAEVGRFEEAAGFAAEGIALATTTHHPDTLFWAHRAAGLRHLAQGDASSATVALEHAHEICRTFDMAAGLTRIRAELGLAWALDGRITEALPMLERAADDAARLKQAMTYPKVLLLLGEVYRIAGMLRKSAEAAESALERFRQHSERGHEAWTLRLLAEIAAEQNSFDVSVAVTRYGAAVGLAEELGMRPLAARCRLGLGRLLRATGDHVRATEKLRSARAEFRAMGMAESLSEAEAELRALA
jgi:class 3 adenylate cyclase/tetratricopeptide (TPR) repeat protein